MKYLSTISLLFYANAMFGIVPHAYVTNQLGNSVTIIDVTNDTTQTIFGFANPRVVRLTPDGTLAYVGCDDNTIRTIETITHTVLPTVISVNHPVAMAIAPDAQHIYVASQDDTVSVIRTSDNATVAVISGFNNPQDIKVNPDGMSIYVTNSDNGTVSVIDTSTNTISNTITGFKVPIGLTFNVDGTFAYVTDTKNNSVYVVDVMTSMISDIILGFNLPSYSAVGPDKNFVFVANGGNETVQIIRTSDNFLLANSISIPEPKSIAVTDNGLFLYVGSDFGSVFKVNLIDYSIVNVLPGFGNPSNISTTTNNAPPESVNACQTTVVSPANIYNVISWSEGPGMPTGYKIYRDVARTKLVATLPAGTTQYSDMHLEEGQSYSYFVLATYANGFSSTIGKVEVSPVRICQ